MFAPARLARHSAARHGTVRHGAVRHGMTRCGTARRGTARHGTARHRSAQLSSKSLNSAERHLPAGQRLYPTQSDAARSDPAHHIGPRRFAAQHITAVRKRGTIQLSAPLLSPVQHGASQHCAQCHSAPRRCFVRGRAAQRTACDAPHPGGGAVCDNPTAAGPGGRPGRGTAAAGPTLRSGSAEPQ